ncbi:MAG TPA: PQQ-dependent sugar dehydrogenase [Roseiflexaceae bacterium]|nr:PQQ-dependent sugar dehydrogenase [Roseiflexaceae bacterium]
MVSRLPYLATLAALLLVSACGSLPGAASPPSPTPAATRVPPRLPPEDAASARLAVPPGFAVRIFAAGLDNPRLMTVGPDGQLYVAERGAGAVVRLPDEDGDGLADARQLLAEGLERPHNLEWFQGALYVAEDGRISRLTDANGDGDMLDDGERTTVTENIPRGGAHHSRTLHFGPDGKLYVAAGSSGNNDVEDDRRRATIMRFNPDGSIPQDNPFATDPEETRRPVWAEGLRNSVDFLWLPDGRLWANHNGVDGLGDELPPEEIVVQVEPGRHYGWPFCYTRELGAVPPGAREVRDERVPLGRLASCDEAVPALFTDTAHYAPLGMALYRANQFPPEYQGNLFVAYHGSWNSAVPRDCRVQMVVVRDGRPVESRPFLTGFRDSEAQMCREAWGRPTGVVVGAGGELFVADGENGNIYRIVYVGS